MGPAGVWLGISLSTVIIGLLAIWRFKSGIWKEQRV